METIHRNTKPRNHRGPLASYWLQDLSPAKETHAWFWKAWTVGFEYPRQGDPFLSGLTTIHSAIWYYVF